MYTGGRRQALRNIGVDVTTSSTKIADADYTRREITLVNSGSTDVDIALEVGAPGVKEGTVPVATALTGIRLKALGGSWTSTEFKGAIAGIADTSTSRVQGVEL